MSLRATIYDDVLSRFSPPLILTQEQAVIDRPDRTYLELSFPSHRAQGTVSGGVGMISKHLHVLFPLATCPYTSTSDLIQDKTVQV
jgi:hypothetical protein